MLLRTFRTCTVFPILLNPLLADLSIIPRKKIHQYTLESLQNIPPNRKFLNATGPSWRTTFHMEMNFSCTSIVLQTKLIFIWKVVDQDSFWNRTKMAFSTEQISSALLNNCFNILYSNWFITDSLNSCMFFSAFHSLHLFPRLASVTHFPALGTR